MKKPDNGIIGIYKITNPKGKVYIGKSNNILKRYYKYKNIKCHKQIRIYNSLKKYGPENHEFEIIEECFVDSLIEKEIFYKEKFIKDKGWDNALFCNINDGESGPKIQSEQSNLKRSEALRGYWSNKIHPVKGKPLSKDIIEKRLKPINQYDIEGNFIKEWSSQLEVYNILGLQINGCLKKINKTSGGFQWLYKEDTNSNKIECIKPRACVKPYKKPPRTKEHCINISKNKIGKGLKPIIQLDLEGNIIKEWDSVSEASILTQTSISGISSCVNGKNKTSNKFKWKYKE